MVKQATFSDTLMQNTWFEFSVLTMIPERIGLTSAEKRPR